MLFNFNYKKIFFIENIEEGIKLAQLESWRCIQRWYGKRVYCTFQIDQ